MSEVQYVQNRLAERDSEIDKLKAEAKHLRTLNDDAHAVIARIWAIFGNPSYEELKGRTIYDLVQEAANASKGSKTK